MVTKIENYFVFVLHKKAMLHNLKKKKMEHHNMVFVCLFKI